MNAASKTMITVFVSENNPISQKSYDDAMDQLDPFRLPCTCGCSGSLIRYGSYRRSVKADGTKFPLIIRRVLCQSCGRSHALIPSSLVPYSQIPLKDQASLIQALKKESARMLYLMQTLRLMNARLSVSSECI